jgi:hypothetical protein
MRWQKMENKRFATTYQMTSACSKNHPRKMLT